MSFQRKLKLGAASLLLASLFQPAFAGATLDSILGPVEFKFAGFSTEQNTTAGSNESTWAVGNVTSITDGFNNLWASGDDGDRLTFVMSGIADLSTTGAGPFSIYNHGATGGIGPDGKIHINIYLDTGPVTVADVSGGPGARTDFYNYPTLTDGSLWLALELVPGIVVDDPATALDEGALATLAQTAALTTSPTSGSGIFYASVVGGSAAGTFDSNGFTTLLGTQADMLGQFDFKPALTTPGCAGGPVNPGCWENVLNDPVLGFAIVPTPAPILLLGLGALCAALVSRRRTHA